MLDRPKYWNNSSDNVDYKVWRIWRRRATAELPSEAIPDLVTASFVRLHIPYTCRQPGLVLALLRRDLVRRTSRIWHRYGFCPALRLRFFVPLLLSPDAQIAKEILRKCPLAARGNKRIAFGQQDFRNAMRRDVTP